MNHSVIGVASMALIGAEAQAGNFESHAVGAAPAGWTCGVTGRGPSELDCRAGHQRAEPGLCGAI